jgi:hypothetical protein
VNDHSRHTRAQPDPEHTVEQPGPPAEPPTALFPQFGGEPVAPVDHVAAKDRVDPNQASWSGAPIEPAEEDLDLLADSNRRPGKLTVTLMAGILAAAAFGGGVLVQKHYGGTATQAGGRGTAGAAAGFPRNFGGGAGGYGNFGGGGGTGGAGQTGGAGGGAAAGAAADTPSVVGTVVKVSGTTVTVKNFAGKIITVKVPDGTTISLSSTLSLTGLKAGTTVSVVGATAADGSVTASAVTARK